MDAKLIFVVFLSVTICNGVYYRERPVPIYRRLFSNDETVVIGAPSYPHHLPEAEAILPGHTLIRPSLGMLKSALKFPHKELDNGAGVNGNINQLGIRYDGKNERVLYNSFRRTPTDYNMMFSPTNMVHKVRNKLKSRLHSSAKTLAYVAKLLRKVRSVQNERRVADIIVLNPGVADVENGAADNMETVANMQRYWRPKSKTIMESKNDFNIIKVQPFAPTIEDFMPKDTSSDKLRRWWYYHQADFRPFIEDKN